MNKILTDMGSDSGKAPNPPDTNRWIYQTRIRKWVKSCASFKAFFKQSSGFYLLNLLLRFPAASNCQIKTGSQNSSSENNEIQKKYGGNVGERFFGPVRVRSLFGKKIWAKWAVNKRNTRSRIRKTGIGLHPNDAVKLHLRKPVPSR